MTQRAWGSAAEVIRALTSAASRCPGRLQPFRRGDHCKTRPLGLFERARRAFRAVAAMACGATIWGILLQTTLAG